MKNTTARICIQGVIYFASLLAGVHAFRISGIPVPIVTGTSGFIGCFADNQHDPDFIFATKEPHAITPNKCREICKQRWFKYAAVQNGDTCWCGISYGKHGRQPDAECETKKCSNDPEQFCGGFLRNKVMRSGYTLDNGKKVDKCWQKNGNEDFMTKVYIGMKNSHGYCKSICGAFNMKYAAVHNGTQCWCSDDILRHDLIKSDCNDVCSGNLFEKCGKVGSMIVMHSYKTGSSIGQKFVVGCYGDITPDSNSHVFTWNSRKEGFNSNTRMTRHYCQIGCSKLGFKLAGVSSGSQCWCGNGLDFNSFFLTDSDHCDAPCSGDKLQTCGAPDFVYVMSTIPGRK